VVPEVLLADDNEQAWAPARELGKRPSPDERVKLKGVEALLTPGAVPGQIEVILEECPPVLQVSGLCASVQRGIASGGLAHGTLQLSSNVVEVGPNLVHRKLIECFSRRQTDSHRGM
jgi:hypothetical protein